MAMPSSARLSSRAVSVALMPPPAPSVRLSSSSCRSIRRAMAASIRMPSATVPVSSPSMVMGATPRASSASKAASMSQMPVE